MPEAGVPARARRRYAAPWWEELDREAFRFPAAHETNRAARVTSDRLAPVEVRVAAPDDVRVAAPATVRAAAPVAARVTAPRATGQATAPRAATPPAVGERSYAESGRRTVTITGRGTERNMPMPRPALRRHERPGFRPDRAALWAVILGLVLILVAVASAHGAVVH